MKLATLRNGHRDGQLIVVHRDLSTFVAGPSAFPTLQAALDDWDTAQPVLQALSEQLHSRALDGQKLDMDRLHAPLPRAYEWVDGSAYINHIVLVRKARGAQPPETLRTDPLVYQGGSGVLLGPHDPLPLPDPAWGLDFESEVALILGDMPRGTTAAQAPHYVRLVTLANDVTYRNLIPAELAKGFGFFTAKPATAFAPVAVTPDELGEHFHDGRVHLRLRSTLNGTVVGDADAGPDMHFSFYDLMAHISQTRAFTAGTILGSGTVSNQDRSRGVSCLAEQRSLETIEHGKPSTPFMKVGDRIEIDMTNALGEPLFGRICQTVVDAS